MERILSLAAEKSRPEPLSFVQPARRRDKVQCHAVSQSSSPRGLPVFTFGDGRGGGRRREHRGHALATARRPAAGLPRWFVQLLGGLWFQGMWAAGAGGTPGRWSRHGTKQKERSVLFSEWQGVWQGSTLWASLAFPGKRAPRIRAKPPASSRVTGSFVKMLEDNSKVRRTNVLHCPTSKVITAVIFLCTRRPLFGSLCICTSFQLISSEVCSACQGFSITSHVIVVWKGKGCSLFTAILGILLEGSLSMFLQFKVICNLKPQ